MLINTPVSTINIIQTETLRSLVFVSSLIQGVIGKIFSQVFSHIPVKTSKLLYPDGFFLCYIRDHSFFSKCFLKDTSLNLRENIFFRGHPVDLGYDKTLKV